MIKTLYHWRWGLIISILIGLFLPNLVQAQETSYYEMMPYARYVNYRYIGKPEVVGFLSKDIIMEYPPDEEQRFQIVDFTDGIATAIVYQIRDDGLYELGRQPDYREVMDLRSSVDFNQGHSLVIPQSLSVGLTYNRGYSQEIHCQIVDYLPQLNFNGQTYSNVYVIEQASPNNPVVYVYLAQDVGFLFEAVNRTVDGQPAHEPYLWIVGVDGPVQ